MDRSALDKQFMRRAIELAQLAEEEGNLPIGAVITLKSIAKSSVTSNPSLPST